MTALDHGFLLDGGLADLGPHNLFRNPRLVRQSVGKLVTRRGVRNPRRDREHPAQELASILVAVEIDVLRRAVQQVVEILARLFAARPDRPRRPACG